MNTIIAARFSFFLSFFLTFFLDDVLVIFLGDANIGNKLGHVVPLMTLANGIDSRDIGQDLRSEDLVNCSAHHHQESECKRKLTVSFFDLRKRLTDVIDVQQSTYNGRSTFCLDDVLVIFLEDANISNKLGLVVPLTTLATGIGSRGIGQDLRREDYVN
jgi:hypothetical protein